MPSHSMANLFIDQTAGKSRRLAASEFRIPKIMKNASPREKESEATIYRETALKIVVMDVTAILFIFIFC